MEKVAPYIEIDALAQRASIMARDICSLHHTEWDPTATVSVAALGATLCIWFVLIGLTSIVGGVAAWKRGLVYYVSYRYAVHAVRACLLLKGDDASKRVSESCAVNVFNTFLHALFKYCSCRKDKQVRCHWSNILTLLHVNHQPGSFGAVDAPGVLHPVGNVLGRGNTQLRPARVAVDLHRDWVPACAHSPSPHQLAYRVPVREHV